MSVHLRPLETRQVTLFDLLDTALDKGIVVQGDATISVADVDLVFLGLKLVLTSVETMRSWRREADGGREDGGNPTCEAPAIREDPEVGARGRRVGPHDVMASEGKPPSTAAAGPCPTTIERLAAEPEKAEKGLAKLVLTVVELLRRLLEEQAVRRMHGGSLTDDEVERMGMVFQ
ncbi:MAG TPA: gas vesicle protein GvpJ, partial [Armatimonadota bacterium]|nr:gas vesicle protein GvpJ [Armatimonadota bacterium]